MGKTKRSLLCCCNRVLILLVFVLSISSLISDRCIFAVVFATSESVDKNQGQHYSAPELPVYQVQVFPHLQTETITLTSFLHHPSTRNIPARAGLNYGNFYVQVFFHSFSGLPEATQDILQFFPPSESNIFKFDEIATMLTSPDGLREYLATNHNQTLIALFSLLRCLFFHPKARHSLGQYTLHRQKYNTVSNYNGESTNSSSTPFPHINTEYYHTLFDEIIAIFKSHWRYLSKRQDMARLLNLFRFAVYFVDISNYKNIYDGNISPRMNNNNDGGNDEARNEINKKTQELIKYIGEMLNLLQQEIYSFVVDYFKTNLRKTTIFHDNQNNYYGDILMGGHDPNGFQNKRDYDDIRELDFTYRLHRTMAMNMLSLVKEKSQWLQLVLELTYLLSLGHYDSGEVDDIYDLFILYMESISPKNPHEDGQNSDYENLLRSIVTFNEEVFLFPRIIRLNIQKQDLNFSKHERDKMFPPFNFYLPSPKITIPSIWYVPLPHWFLSYSGISSSKRKYALQLWSSISTSHIHSQSDLTNTAITDEMNKNSKDNQGISLSDETNGVNNINSGSVSKIDGTKQSKFRIGILSAWICRSSMSRFLNGLLDIFENLLEFEVMLLQLGEFCKEEGNIYTERLKSRFTEIYKLPLAHNLIEANDIHQTVSNLASLDVLIITDIGMTIASYWVSSWKFAPTQILLWGHPLTSGFGPDVIDYYVIPGDAVPDVEYSSMFTEQLVRFDSLAVGFPNVRTDDSKIHEITDPLRGTEEDHRVNNIGDINNMTKFAIRQHLTEKYGLRFPRENQTFHEYRVYGVPQTCEKFHPDFDFVLMRILDHDQNGLLLISHCPFLLDRLLPFYPERIVLLPTEPVGIHLFQMFLRSADVILEPFPFPSTYVSLDALDVGTIVVAAGAIAEEYDMPQLTTAIYRSCSKLEQNKAKTFNEDENSNMKVTEVEIKEQQKRQNETDLLLDRVIAQNKDDYVHKAIAIAWNEDFIQDRILELWRKKRGEALADQRSEMMEEEWKYFLTNI